MESLRPEANSPQQLQPIRRGWKLGGEDFLDWILDKMEVPTKEAHPSRELDETEQAKALRIVRAFAQVRFAFWIQTARSNTPFRLMKQNENYDRRDDLLHRRTSERVFNLSHDFLFVSLVSLGPRLQSVDPTIERDLCTAAVLLRFGY